MAYNQCNFFAIIVCILYDKNDDNDDDHAHNDNDDDRAHDDDHDD